MASVRTVSQSTLWYILAAISNVARTVGVRSMTSMVEIQSHATFVDTRNVCSVLCSSTMVKLASKLSKQLTWTSRKYTAQLLSIQLSDTRCASGVTTFFVSHSVVTFTAKDARWRSACIADYQQVRATWTHLQKTLAVFLKSELRNKLLVLRRARVLPLWLTHHVWEVYWYLGC